MHVHLLFLESSMQLQSAGLGLSAILASGPLLPQAPLESAFTLFNFCGNPFSFFMREIS